MEISLNDIHKHYGRVHANNGITVRLEPGRIYGLLGENGAGKSTLMRILAGHTIPDQGSIIIDGRDAGRLTPQKALDYGIGMLYQDPLDFPAMKVWENFSLGGLKRSRTEALARLNELAEPLQFQFNPDEKVGEITVGERQQLELLRLLDAGVKTLILDEPTTGISLPQKVKLFQNIKKLAAEKDRIIIIVTHKLEDALDLCHNILIMRQGKMVSRLEPPFSSDKIVNIMFDSDAENGQNENNRPKVVDENRLSLRGARFTGEKFELSDLDLHIRPGEIIGLAGLEGNGQELFLRGLAGLARVTAGQVIFAGRELQFRPYRNYRQAGIHFLPAARLEQGLFPDLSLTEHICLAFPDQKKRLNEFYREECAERFQLLAEPGTCAKSLSGGNQQRLLLSLIPKNTRLLLMEHPTRGLDVGSARQVWSTLKDRCRNGASLVFSSADMDELLEHSHRIFVFYNRKLIADVPLESANVEVIGGLMAGQEKAA